jgi:hypothetical protein
LCALTLLESEFPPLPEYKPFYHGEIISSSNYELKIKLIGLKKFKHGSRITTEHYLNRFLFLKEKHTILSHTLLKNIHLKINGDLLTFNAPYSTEPLEKLLRSILFTPKISLDKVEEAGEYTIKSESNVWLANKFGSHHNEESIKFIIVKDPLDNYRLTEMNFLTQTADTATPWIPSLSIPNGYKDISRSSSLHGYIFFRNRLATSDNLLLRRSFYNFLGRYLEIILSLTHWKKTLSDFIFEINEYDTGILYKFFKHSPLIISYNDFHPNASIIFFISSLLEKYKINHVIFRDDFYKPNIKSDMSLTIINGSIPGEWGQYYSLIFCPAIIQDKKMLTTFLNTLKYDISHIEKKQRIKMYFQYIYPFIYLGEIPSYYYRKI